MEAMFRNLRGKPQFRKPDVPTETQTQQLPTRRLEACRQGERALW
jgi:hypothetical protein